MNRDPAPRVIVAPQSFKGSADAVAVASAIARGIRRAWPGARVEEMPLADGGEGTVRALVTATSGGTRRSRVHDPLGREIDAEWGVLGDGVTAVVEMAAASGLPLLESSERDPRITSTRGTGELILAAAASGAHRIVIGIGGSATNDGGAGMARAFGYRFLDRSGNDLPEGGAALARLGRIDGQTDPRLVRPSIAVACDGRIRRTYRGRRPRRHRGRSRRSAKRFREAHGRGDGGRAPRRRTGGRDRRESRRRTRDARSRRDRDRERGCPDDAGDARAAAPN